MAPAWALRTLPVAAYWTGIAFGNGVFVAVGGGTDTGAISEDGVTWTPVTLPAMGGWFSIAFGNGIFVATPGEPDPPVRMVLATSPDGINWTMGPRHDYEPAYSRVVFDNGLFVLLDQGGRAQASVDGITWTDTFVPYPDPMFYLGWLSLAAGNGRFVAGPDVSPMIASSSDGLNWVQNHVGIWAGVRWIAFGNGVFVAALHDEFTGQSARDVVSSPDGINWTLKTNDAPWKDNYTGPATGTFGNGLFLATINGPVFTEVGTDVAYTSPDGAVWTPITLPAAGEWRVAGFGGGAFVLLEPGKNIAAVWGKVGPAGPGPYLRLTQRDDGLGIQRAPRLAGADSNGPTSVQSNSSRIGTSNTYQ